MPEVFTWVTPDASKGIDMLDLRDKFEEFVANLRFGARTLLAFCSGRVSELRMALDFLVDEARNGVGDRGRYDWAGGCRRALEAFPVLDADWLADLLPADCVTVSMATDTGITMPNYPADLEVSEDGGPTHGLPALSAVAFPEMNGVTVVPFNQAAIYPSPALKPFNSQRNAEDVDEAISGFLEDKVTEEEFGELACVLHFFMRQPAYSGMTAEVLEAYPVIFGQDSLAVSRAVGQFARMTGTPVQDDLMAMAKSAETPETFGDWDKMACGLVIAGSRVRAASVTLRESDEGHEQIERLLGSLKEKNFDEERTIGFMFTTDGRRRRY